MTEPFDAYHKWLGIPPEEQPPDHYRLLQITRFESDADVIDNAANRLMSFLQDVASGPRIADSQKLLNEISAARIILLDEAKRTAYNATLALTSESPQGKQTSSVQSSDNPQLIPTQSIPTQPRPLQTDTAESPIDLAALEPLPASPLQTPSNGLKSSSFASNSHSQAGRSSHTGFNPLVLLAVAGALVMIFIFALIAGALFILGGDGEVANSNAQTSPKQVAAQQSPQSSDEMKAGESIESADGIFHERFAFCQTMPLNEFQKVAETLRPYRYRPVRVRPYASRGRVLVAAVWRRDDIDWRLSLNANAEEIRSYDASLRSEAMLPVDAAGYQDGNVVKYAAVWEASPRQQKRALLVGLTEETKKEKVPPLFQNNYLVRVNQAFLSPQDEKMNCHIWEQVPPKTPHRYFGGTAGYYRNELAKPNALPLDICVTRALGRNDQPIALYTGTVTYVQKWKSESLIDLSPAEHKASCRQLISQGYFPVAIGVASVHEDENLVATSIWYESGTVVFSDHPAP